MYRRLSARLVTQREGTALESPLAQTIARQVLNCSAAADGGKGKIPNFSALSKTNRESSSFLNV
jgi:hypothetical protein